MKKTNLLIVLALVLATLTLNAHTDVTNLYMTNAGFDDSSCFVGTNVFTYAKDITNGEVSGCQPVNGWAIDATAFGDAKAGGAFAFGSGLWMAGADYVVPAADSEGGSAGGMLGLAGCWSSSAGYSQQVTLPVGTYKLSYRVYNAGENIAENYSNEIGYIDEYGTTYYSNDVFPTGEWTEGCVLLSFTSCSFGKVHVGYKCGNVGSGSSPKLFVDYIKIEKFSTEELIGGDFTSYVNPAGWNGEKPYTDGNGVTAMETFEWAASLSLGRHLEQTVRGLPNGTYTLKMYVGASSTSERDNVNHVITDGSTGYVSLHANDASIGVKAMNRLAIDAFDVVTLTDVHVTDGALDIYLQEDAEGPNWLTLQIKELVLVTPSGEPLGEGYYQEDVNDDGNVNVADVTLLVSKILDGQTQATRPDVNGDHNINVADVTALVGAILDPSKQTYVENVPNEYAVRARVYAEQSNNENASQPSAYVLSVINPYTLSDVTAEAELSSFFTVMDIDCSQLPAGVSSVSVFANGKEAIAGVMCYHSLNDRVDVYAGEAPSVYADDMLSDVVTVSGSATTFRAYLLPVNLPNGVTITARMADGKYYSQTFSESITPFSRREITLTIADADTNLWMATIPGNVYFSMLSTPGAHDAATAGVTQYSYFAKCQSETLEQLLENGVRAFDLRPRYNSSKSTDADIRLENLEIYHGIVPTGVKFKDAIDILIRFVKAHPSEALSVIMNKEDSGDGTDYSSTWRVSLRECFGDESRSPWLIGSVRGYHTLDDVRGKVSIVSRNPYGNADNSYRDVVYGAIIESWPDDGLVTDYSCPMTQAWNWVDCRANVEDAYNDGNADKKTHVAQMLNLASANTDHFHYHYTYTSIAGSLLSSLTSHASELNPWTASYLTQSVTGPAGYVYADYMGSSQYDGETLLRAVVEQNYKYVFKGQSRLSE